MPELPEVETTRRGIQPYCEGRRVTSVVIRDRRLRWPVSDDLPALLAGQQVLRVERRAKYLLLHTDAGVLLIHLGMSGSLRVLLEPLHAAKHDHIDLCLEGDVILRYNDPRRFGSFQWFPTGYTLTPLVKLGPEPLSKDFDGALLYERSRRRKAPVKAFVMDESPCRAMNSWPAKSKQYWRRLSSAAGRRCEILSAAMGNQAIFLKSCSPTDGVASSVSIAIES